MCENMYRRSARRLTHYESSLTPGKYQTSPSGSLFHHPANSFATATVVAAFQRTSA